MRDLADIEHWIVVLQRVVAVMIAERSFGTPELRRYLPHQRKFSVRDQGPGFKEEDKAKMFRRYGRLSARPTGGEPSTGLGLSIVKTLVQNMRGELICESTPSQGATFYLRLPRPDRLD